MPLRPNDRWSMDFVADTFGASRRLRILAINDDACRDDLPPADPAVITRVRRFDIRARPPAQARRA